MEDHNPWWIGEDHSKIIEWEEYEVKWIPKIIDLLDSKGFSLNFIVGPRQVGKTLLTLLFIKKKLLSKIDPRGIFYFSCDEVSDFRELGEILDSYLSFRESHGLKRSYIFLDEITFVDDWWRALKSRIDKGKLKNDSVYVTGSASLEILKSRERFPGRRGMGKDIFVFPMSFSEYVNQFTEIPIQSVEFTKTDRFDEFFKANRIFSKKLLEIYEKYLTSGGFPLAIREYFERNRMPVDAQKVYLNWLINDLVKLGKSEKVAKEVLSVIIKSRLSPISWNEITKETSLSSPNTVRSYVETLEDLFILKILYQYDKRPMYRKNKKIHIIDPFLYHTISRWTRTEVLTETIVESTIVSHIMRMMEIFYWKNKSEMDILAINNDSRIGIEVKWGYKKWRKPPHVPKVYLLKKEDNPIFLATGKWETGQIHTYGV